MSNNGLRRTGYNWRDHEDGPHGASPQDDPLSELARLIEEDPFADFDQGRRAPAPQRSQEAPRAQEPSQSWPWNADAHDAGATPAHESDEYAQFENGEWAAPHDAHGYAPLPGEHGEPAEALYDEPHEADWNAEPAYQETYPAEPDMFGYDEDGRRQRIEPAVYASGYDYDEGAPHYDESGHLAPLAPEPRGSRVRRTAMFGGLALVAVVVGVGAVAYRGLSPAVTDGPPLVVAADPQPVKVKPEEPGGAKVANQDKIVFDRANGIAGGGKTEERIVSREEPVEEVALREGAAGAPRTVGADEPKRVRTVVVKPDGTIVETPAAAQAKPERVVAMRETAPDSGPVTLYDSGTAPAEGNSAAPAAAASSADADTATPDGVPVPPARPAGAANVAANANKPAPSFVPPSATEERAARANAASQANGQPLQLVPQQSAPASQPTRVATAPATGNDAAALVQSGSQTNAGQPAPAAAPNTGGFPSGGYVVQVSSTRSASDAESVAARVKSQYGNVLSGYETGVQRADLGDRGVYYRVAVGPLSDSSAAAGLCGRLKSAGLDCFVRRN